MRLVAWNTNYNINRRSLEEAYSLIGHLAPDIAVLSEVSPPLPDNPLGAIWVGDSAPGLAVVANENVEAQMGPEDADTPPLSFACKVSGKFLFDLIAIWPVQRKGGPTYAQILQDVLVRYFDVIKCGRTVIAGDFNSSTRVKSQRKTHPTFVDEAASMGLVSAYHHVTGELHGSETMATYLHGPKESHRFHIDYCFVPAAFTNKCTIEVLETDYWASQSDHFPLVLEIDDLLLSNPSF